MRLIKGLPDGKLVQRIVRFLRMGGISERGLGFYLLDFNRRGLFKRHGFSSTAHFALMKLQVSLRKTRDLLRVARTLEELPLIDRAFAEGKISWSAVRELTRVAVKETEGEWLALAEGSTLRKIEGTVSRAVLGERPPKDPYSLSKTKYRVEADLSSEDYAVVQTAWARLRETAGEELDAASAVVLLAQKFLEQPLEQVEKESRKAFQVVYHRCSQCDRAWVEGSDGPEGISNSKVAKREKEAEVIHIEKAGQKSGEATDQKSGEATDWKEELGDPRGSSTLTPSDPRGSSTHTPRDPRGSDLRMPAKPARLPVPFNARDLPNTPKIRHQVLSRDGGICAVPGCSNRGTLFAHHVVWRSLGGRTELENEVCLCRNCHSAVHEGLLTVEGEAPHGLLWKDGTGKSIETGLTADDGGLRYTMEPGQSDPRGARGSIEEREDTTIYSLDEVPSEVDGAWWQKYGHNFEFKGRRVVLKAAR